MTTMNKKYILWGAYGVLAALAAYAAYVFWPRPEPDPERVDSMVPEPRKRFSIANPIADWWATPTPEATPSDYPDFSIGGAANDIAYAGGSATFDESGGGFSIGGAVSEPDPYLAQTADEPWTVPL